jgi:hypothetical protein
MTNPTFTDDDLEGINHLIIKANGTGPDAMVRIVPAPEYMATAILNRADRLRPRSSTGRAPRTGTNTRTRGSRRTRTKAPSRGDPDGDPDPGGPARADQGDLTEGRHCLGCGHSIDQKRAQALYCNEACRKVYIRAGRVAAKPVIVTDVIPLADVLGEINKTATVRQRAWRSEIEADTQALTRQLAELWHEARRARALGVIA